MGDDQRPDAPSLEAPSLGKLFGRRKGRTPAADPAPEQPAPPADPAAAPAADSGAPADQAPAAAEPAAPRAASVPPAQPAAQAPAAAPTRSSGQPPAQPAAPAVPPSDEDTAVLPPAAAPPAAAPPIVPPTAPVPTSAPAAASAPVPVVAEPAPEPQLHEQAPAKPRAPRAMLTVDGRVATGITGLVVGLLVVVLTAGSLALCENVRGVSSCGGGPGFLLLVLVMAGMVVLGGVMLRLARVPDPTSTSFLAVGLLAVLSLLFLVDVLEEWWMIIVIPLLSAGMFLLSHWVTTQVVDSDT